MRPIPQFSVVITNYNYEAFLAETVESVLLQSLIPLEIFIVDDGSQDGSRELIQKLASHPLITPIFRTQNGGQWASLRDGVAAAKGDFVAFLDADDLWETNYLSRVSSAIREKEACDFIYTGWTNFGTRSGQEGIEVNGGARDLGPTRLLNWICPGWLSGPTSACVLSRDHAHRILALPLDREWRICADNGVQLLSGLMGASKCHLAEPLMRYRQHQKNLWNQKNLTQRNEYLVEIGSARTLGEYTLRIEPGLHELLGRVASCRRSAEYLCKSLYLEASLGQKPNVVLKDYCKVLKGIRTAKLARKWKFHRKIKKLLSVNEFKESKIPINSNS